MNKEMMLSGLTAELERCPDNGPVRDFLSELLAEVGSGGIAPVAEAEWVGDLCSACGGLCHDTYDYTSIYTAYCPNCGAKMRNPDRWDLPRERRGTKKESIVKGLEAALELHPEGDPSRGFLSELKAEVENGAVAHAAEGEWTYECHDDVCSVCGGPAHHSYGPAEMTDYCHHCGAKMKKVERKPPEKKKPVLKHPGKRFVQVLDTSNPNRIHWYWRDSSDSGDFDAAVKRFAETMPEDTEWGVRLVWKSFDPESFRVSEEELMTVRGRGSEYGEPDGDGDPGTADDLNVEKATRRGLQTLEPDDIDSLGPGRDSWDWFDNPRFAVHDDMDRNYEEAKERIHASLARSGFYRGVRILERTFDPETWRVGRKVIRSYERKSFRNEVTGRLEGPLWVEENNE